MILLKLLFSLAVHFRFILKYVDSKKVGIFRVLLPFVKTE